MSSYEPEFGRKHATSVSVRSADKQKEFSKKWKENVTGRVDTWWANRENQSLSAPQLKFTAECCEYSAFLHKQVAPSKSRPLASALDDLIMMAGPVFDPLTYAQEQMRNPTASVTPETACLKSVHIISPDYYPQLRRCPQCGATGNNLTWNGWNPTGPREVYGLQRGEMAIGVQLRCKNCEAIHQQQVKDGVPKNEQKQYCFCTTSHIWWEKVEHWDRPPGLPFFYHRSAVTAELHDFIIQSHPRHTAAGLAEDVRQMHLLEYHRQRLAYLRRYQERSKQSALVENARLQNFPKPETAGASKQGFGYDCRSISDDKISEIWNTFCALTRQRESEASLRAKTAITISVDATFRTAFKATYIENDQSRTRSYKGGLCSAINEHGDIMGWRFSYTKNNAELKELLLGFRDRFDLHKVAYPEIVVADNCCYIKNAVKDVFPDACVGLDVWHCIMRYLICVAGGTKNPLRPAIAQDIREAILRAPAKDRVPAVYRSREDQETRLEEVFQKWARHGGIWTAAAEKTHHEQLTHVRKGCLTRPRSDIASDGSRIEGTHKGWNGLQRSFSSGLETMTGLCHDFVLRRNLRNELTRDNATEFARSTHGSHHITLVNECAKLFNSLIEMLQSKGSRYAPAADVTPLPVFVTVDSKEYFGLVKMSPTSAAYQSMVHIKDEALDDDKLLDLSSQDFLNAHKILSDIGIDPSLLHNLASPSPAPSPALVKDSTTRSGSSASDAINIDGPGPAASASSHATDVKGKGRMITDDPPTVSTVARRKRADSPEVTEYTILPTLSAGAASTASSSTAMGGTTTSRTIVTSAYQLEQQQPPTKKIRLSVPGMPKAAGGAVRGAQPEASSSSAAPPQGSFSSAITNFFAPQLAPAASTAPIVFQLNLPPYEVTGLTRSQQLFSIVSGINPLALKFTRNKKDAFFVFMDLRAIHKWRSYEMSAFDWLVATTHYNNAISQKNSHRGSTMTLKVPRALLEKLREVEADILMREKQGNYKSRSGSENFWQKHCKAVALTSKPLQLGEVDGKQKTCKDHTCSRCKVLMYAGGVGSNHRRGVCGDGVWSTARKFTKMVNGVSSDNHKETPPPFPQPAKIFEDAKTFNARTFVRKMEDLYECLVVQRAELGMEELALATMFYERTVVIPPSADNNYHGMTLFKLFGNLQLSNLRDEVVDPHQLHLINGDLYMRLDYYSADLQAHPVNTDETGATGAMGNADETGGTGAMGNAMGNADETGATGMTDTTGATGTDTQQAE